MANLRFSSLWLKNLKTALIFEYFMLKRLTEVVIKCRDKTRMPSYPQIAVYFFKKTFKRKGLPYNT